MSDNKYDVLISYRRDYKGVDGTKHSNIPTARAIESQFSKRGYEVFLDMEKCTDGRFEDEIIPAIKTCVYFVLLLTKDSLKRCQNEGDWVRREIEVALKSPCKIIIVTPDGEVPACPKGLPASIASIDGIEISDIGVSRKTFSSDIDFIISTRMGSPVVKKDNRLENCAKLKVTSNLDCLMYVDGDEEKDVRAHIVANKLEKIPLPPGEYVFKFVSEDKKDIVRDSLFIMPSQDKVYPLVDLLRVKQEREQREQETDWKEQEEKKRKVREAQGEIEVKGVKFKMVYVEGGTFTMGATEEQGRDADDDEKPEHEVRLDDYYIGETVVTQELWKAVMGSNSNPSFFTDSDNLPVERVSWEDAQAFIKKLNEITHRTFRLPTEEEWEYAARGGEEHKGYKYSGSNYIDKVAWYQKNSDSMTHPVKRKLPNDLGLYDMSGNVEEWCQDRYGQYISGVQKKQQDSISGANRVIRGGSWILGAGQCRVSYRNYDKQTFQCYYLGFRLVMNP